MSKRYPNTLKGLFEIDIEKQILYPIVLPKKTDNDYRLRKITLMGGIGLAKFENGFSIPLIVNYNLYITQYSFTYNGQEHIFEIKACLSGLIESVEILDFSQGC